MGQICGCTEPERPIKKEVQLLSTRRHFNVRSLSYRVPNSPIKYAKAYFYYRT